MMRIVFLIGAYFFLALAILGAFLPVLPTVPFLLLAAWCAAKGSERLHRWMYAHPKLGPMLTNWDEHKAVSRKNKITAIAMLSASWLFLFFNLDNRVLFYGITALFCVVSTFLITRPEPP
ncbi:MAG: YbaN family protein [Pseudomonadota bacterium]